MPRGWSQYFLNSFAYAGCLVTALEERRAMYREAGKTCFPEHFGASCGAGLEWEEDKAREEERRWNRRPPGKRAEWGKLGTRWPFKPDWEAIISVSSASLFVPSARARSLIAFCTGGLS
jgi:ribonuclease P/MRP protein subunit POP1